MNSMADIRAEAALRQRIEIYDRVLGDVKSLEQRRERTAKERKRATDLIKSINKIGEQVQTLPANQAALVSSGVMGRQTLACGKSLALDALGGMVTRLATELDTLKAEDDRNMAKLNKLRSTLDAEYSDLGGSAATVQG